MLWTNLILQKLGREITPLIRMIGFWFLHSALPLMTLYQCIKFHLFIFDTFRDTLWTSLLLYILGREITVITCDRVTILALYTFSDGLLSMYPVSFNSLLYFQRSAQESFLLQKNRKGSNSLNTGNKLTVLAFCTSPQDPLSVYQVSFN